LGRGHGQNVDERIAQIKQKRESSLNAQRPRTKIKIRKPQTRHAPQIIVAARSSPNGKDHAFAATVRQILAAPSGVR